MAKKEDKKKEAETSAAGTQEPETPAADTQEPETPAADTREPETSADDNQGSTTAEIETVEDLESCYPQLVSEIRDEVIKSIEKCPVKEVKANLPLLYERIFVDIQNKSGPKKMNVPGFLLEVDDPFAESTLRTYQKLKGVDGLRLPYVLPFKDKATRATLENYALRAAGGGDTKRADAAIKAMEKI